MVKRFVFTEPSQMVSGISINQCFNVLFSRCCSCMEGTWIYRKFFFFRSVIHDLVDNPFFEWTVLLLIFASRQDKKIRCLLLNSTYQILEKLFCWYQNSLLIKYGPEFMYTFSKAGYIANALISGPHFLMTCSYKKSINCCQAHS